MAEKEPLAAFVQHSRIIHRSGDEDFLVRLLETVCLAELLSPSRELWLFAAWITDFAILDNSQGTASGLVPEWPNGRIRLTRWLWALAEAGTTLYIETNRDQKNDPFERAIQGLSQALPRDRIHFRRRDTLHAKGMIGDSFCLLGSFNFTRNGILMLDEQGRYDTDLEVVSRMRIEARHRWDLDENAEGQ